MLGAKRILGSEPPKKEKIRAGQCTTKGIHTPDSTT
jgi:hypothetical protein